MQEQAISFVKCILFDIIEQHRKEENVKTRTQSQGPFTLLTAICQTRKIL